MITPLNHTATRLPAPVELDDLPRVIPGQQALALAAAGYRELTPGAPGVIMAATLGRLHLTSQPIPDGEWMRQMITEHGHCGQ